MAVILDSKMPSDVQEHARTIINKYLLDNFKIHYRTENKSIIFERDRRVVTVPITLIEAKNWQDIDFLFRAILSSENSLWNSTADKNDWSGNKYYE